MINSVLLFKCEEINHNSLDCFSEQIANRLRKRGVEVYVVSTKGDAEEVGRKLSQVLTSAHIDAALMLNAYGQQDIELPDGSNLWDSLGIPFYNWIVDHPLEHSENLDCGCKDYHLICIDRNHAKFVKKYYPDIKSVDFLPIAGVGEPSEPPEEYERFSSRRYDVVLTAGLVDPYQIKENFKDFPERIKSIACLWTDHMEKNIDMSPEIALRDVLDQKYGKDAVSDDDFFNLAKICWLAVPYIRTWIRKRIVENLMDSGLPFHLWGTGWEELNASHSRSRAVLHGDMQMKDIPDLYRNVKLGINILPMFKNGTHDRIATAQINGAAMITDENDYLRSFYKDEELFFYRLSEYEILPQIIEEILSDPHKLYDTAIKGQMIGTQKLTDEVVTDRLIEIMGGRRSEIV